MLSVLMLFQANTTTASLLLPNPVLPSLVKLRTQQQKNEKREQISRFLHVVPSERERERERENTQSSSSGA
jgi:hypothetical protein